MSTPASLAVMCVVGVALLVACRTVRRRLALASPRLGLGWWAAAFAAGTLASYVPIRHSAELMTGGLPFPVFVTLTQGGITTTTTLGVISFVTWVGNAVFVYGAADLLRLWWRRNKSPKSLPGPSG